jgi:hypothetical protein
MELLVTIFNIHFFIQIVHSISYVVCRFIRLFSRINCEVLFVFSSLLYLTLAAVKHIKIKYYIIIAYYYHSMPFPLAALSELKDLIAWTLKSWVRMPIKA